MHELTVTTLIDASVEKVREIMAFRQEEWFCPSPWSAEVVIQDKRAGGRSAMVFHGPEGEKLPQEGTYLAWDEGRRFVTTDAIVGDFEPSGPFMIGIWEIEPEVNGTRYTARARHWTEEDCKRHEEMGFAEGWGACARQLKELCEAG